MWFSLYFLSIEPRFNPATVAHLRVVVYRSQHASNFLVYPQLSSPHPFFGARLSAWEHSLTTAPVLTINMATNQMGSLDILRIGSDLRYDQRSEP